MSVTLTRTRSAPAPSSTPRQMSELESVGLAGLSQAPATTEALDTFDVPGAEAVLVIWGIVVECRRPVLLFSESKDPVVTLHLARRAFWPVPISFPVLHVDTDHSFPELLVYHDRTVEESSLRPVMACVRDYIDSNRLHECVDGIRNLLQTILLLDAIEKGGFDGIFGGGHRDEEEAWAKKRIISLCDELGQWDPHNQRFELWNLFNPYRRPSEHMQVLPLSSWTELDVWCYIEREDTASSSLYYAYERKVFLRDGMWLAAGGINRLHDGEQVVTCITRYRAVGDMSCIDVVESTTATDHDIALEVVTSALTRWGVTRAGDRLSGAAVEGRREGGYS